MPTISKKQLEEYEQLKKDRDNGRLRLPTTGFLSRCRKTCISLA